MAVKKKSPVSRAIVVKARKILEFAELRVTKVQYRMELSNALFAPDGMATQTFPTEIERKAFLKTSEYKRIRDLLSSLPYPEPSETIRFSVPSSENGKSKKRR